MNSKTVSRLTLQTEAKLKACIVRNSFKIIKHEDVISDCNMHPEMDVKIA
jgi:hypothetical protein